jgi:hypothetical protein
MSSTFWRASAEFRGASSWIAGLALSASGQDHNLGSQFKFCEDNDYADSEEGECGSTRCQEHRYLNKGCRADWLKMVPTTKARNTENNRKTPD